MINSVLSQTVISGNCEKGIYILRMPAEES